jgi:hypothetical protein
VPKRQPAIGFKKADPQLISATFDMQALTAGQNLSDISRTLSHRNDCILRD